MKKKRKKMNLWSLLWFIIITEDNTGKNARNHVGL